MIQPHLPIRLPCYDFTPVIRPAFELASIRTFYQGCICDAVATEELPFRGALTITTQIYMYAVFKVQSWLIFNQSFKKKISLILKSLVKPVLSLSGLPAFLFLIWRPPALPHRLQCSTIGRLGLNRRVRDGNGCVP